MNYYKILDDCLNNCKINDYKGWDKYDGTLSPILNLRFINNKIIRFSIQQLVKESPINLRNIFKIQKSYNCKALALLLKSYCIINKEKYLNELNKLFHLLLELKSNETLDSSWGYNFTWQTTKNNIKPQQANVTVTFFVAEALIELYLLKKDNQNSSIIFSINNFFKDSIVKLIDEKEYLAYSYFTIPQKNIVYNIQGMIATFYLKYSKLFEDEESKINAFKLCNFLKKSMNEDYTWNYHNGNGYNKIDNYHSAYILDSFWELYQFTKKEEDLDFYLKCLKVYKDKFWGHKGEPYWSLKHKYPYDIHSAANGIITFAKASTIEKKYIEKSKLILDWTINNMYREKEQDFFYRIFGPIKYNYSFIRWGNAWMCYAISEFLKFQDLILKKT